MHCGCNLSGPLRLRFPSGSRTRLRIAASIAFVFCACLEREAVDSSLPVCECEIGPPQLHSRGGPIAVEGGEAEIVQHSIG